MARAMVGAALHKVNKNRNLPLYPRHGIRQTDHEDSGGKRTCLICFWLRSRASWC